MKPRILLLEPPGFRLDEVRGVLAAIVGGAADIETVPDPAALLRGLRRDGSVDLVLVRYPEGDGSGNGAQILADLRLSDGEVPVVAVAERADVRMAGEAVAAGATDLLVRGDRLEERVSTLV